MNPALIKAGLVGAGVWLVWWLWSHPRRVTRETYIEANVLNDNFGRVIDAATGRPIDD